MEKNEPRYPVEGRRSVVILPPVSEDLLENSKNSGKVRKSPFGTAFADKNRRDEKS